MNGLIETMITQPQRESIEIVKVESFLLNQFFPLVMQVWMLGPFHFQRVLLRWQGQVHSNVS